METLRLKQRLPAEDEIENWDDEDFNIDSDDHLTGFMSRSISVATNHRPTRRDSYSSHMSFRSDRDSLHGEEERQVHIPGDDEKSTLDAIAAAASAGIPIPKNVPSSALMGGTIKRLGARKSKRIVQEDWDTDIEMPEPGKGLKMKPRDQNFPEAIRQVSGPLSMPPSSSPSPKKSLRSAANIFPHSLGGNDSPIKSASPSLSSSSPPHAVSINLDRFMDDDDDDDFLGDGCETIRVSKTRRATPIITPPTPLDDDNAPRPECIEDDDDDDDDTNHDFEKDFDLPDCGTLNLAARNDGPRTPTSQHDDFDWGEGSLGVRYGGTRRAGGVRSSSASAMSPSVSSTVTFESEDEAFDDLELPTGPLDFKERLSRRRVSIISSSSSVSGRTSPVGESKPSTPTQDKGGDFLEDLDLGDGEIFDSNKLTNHRNLRVKETTTNSVVPFKTAVTLTFTNKPITQTNSRLPRPSHERTPSMLEPVFESGGSTTQRKRRSIGPLPPRSGGHVQQSSISSIPAPSMLMSGPPPSNLQQRRREVGAKGSNNSLRNEPTTTNAQLLRLKRSMPAINKSPHSPTKMYNNGVPIMNNNGTGSPSASSPTGTPPPPATSRYERPPSRSDRTQPFGRPKTPVDRRPNIDALRAGNARNIPPFIPAGSGAPNTHAIKPRALRRQASEHSIDMRPRSRTVSRSTMRSPSPRRKPSAANDDIWSRLAQPKKAKNFGDGHELDAFDDLPTSIQAESRFMKPALNAAAAKAHHARNNKNNNTTATTTTTTTTTTPPQRMQPSAPSPGPYSSPRAEKLPRFARDTAASRIARETALTSIAQRVPGSTLGPLPFRGGPTRSGAGHHHHHHHHHQSTMRARRRANEPPKKPSLISNLNMSKGPKTVNGMSYNPDTFTWEGNENALSAFDPPSASPLTAPATPLAREKEPVATPRPALITNRTSIKNVQMVGHMMFDPQAMCWIKIGPSPATRSEAATTMDDDEDDVFKDIPDLEEKPTESECGGPTRGTDIKDEWLVGEEFDVGPEFVRRQREEEERWRKKCGKWVGRGSRDRDAWRWTIRELVMAYGGLPLN